MERYNLYKRELDVKAPLSSIKLECPISAAVSFLNVLLFARLSFPNSFTIAKLASRAPSTV